MRDFYDCEKMLARLLTSFLERTGAYGLDQWAFRPKRSCRDLVTLLVCRWIWAMDSGFKVAIYLSDIAGAFDRVDRDILISRLRAAGVSSAMIDLLSSYLAARQAVVIVQGCESKPFLIENQVFQGTVLGPPLSNVFFQPVDQIISALAYRIAKFADDLTAYKNYESSKSNTEIEVDLRKVQHDVHEWGAASRVAFDADKEHFIILHKLDPNGHTFKHLGTLIDPKLVMEEEVQRIKKKVRPKIKAILATRNLYDTKGMTQQYKTHILCLLEQSSGAIYHASEVPLHSIDPLQAQFVREVGLTESEAYLSTTSRR